MFVTTSEEGRSLHGCVPWPPHIDYQAQQHLGKVSQIQLAWGDLEGQKEVESSEEGQTCGWTSLGEVMVPGFVTWVSS